MRSFYTFMPYPLHTDWLPTVSRGLCPASRWRVVSGTVLFSAVVSRLISQLEGPGFESWAVTANGQSPYIRAPVHPAMNMYRVSVVGCLASRGGGLILLRTSNSPVKTAHPKDKIKRNNFSPGSCWGGPRHLPKKGPTPQPRA